MSDKLKIGYLAHWFQPRYRFVDFLQEQGIEAKKIDYSYPGYLEEFEVVLIEQNGFNDYIENDELVEVTPENIRLRKADLTRRIFN